MWASASKGAPDGPLRATPRPIARAGYPPCGCALETSVTQVCPGSLLVILRRVPRAAPAVARCPLVPRIGWMGRPREGRPSVQIISGRGASGT